MNTTRRSFFTQVLSLVLTCVFVSTFALSQAVPLPSYESSGSSNFSFVGGKFIANNYANWGAVSQVYTGNASTGSSTITVRGGYIVLSDGRRIVPFAQNVPFIISDANPELIVPTSVSGCYKAQGMNQDGILVTCTITASFTYLHGAGAGLLTGTGGAAEAVFDAFNRGGGVVVLGPGYSLNTSCTNCYASVSAMMAALLPYASVNIEDDRAAQPQFWSVQPSVLTALATPATRSAGTSCTGHTVCDGTAVGTWTNAATYVCVTYVDILGGESPCSATANYTTAGSLAINFTAPAASTGAVGWRAYAGASYATSYQLPITSANCTLTQLESVIPACAVANTLYNQTASNGVFPTPTTHTQIPPQSGGTAAAYNPNPQSHTTFAYVPSAWPSSGFQRNYGPFVQSPALTAGQLVVLGTVPLPAAYLNAISTTLHISGNVTLTPSTGGTIGIDTEIGDITDFTTGTPKAVCTEGETTATGTAAIKVHFDCTWTVNATGTTGSIMPGGFIMEQLQAGTTTGNLGVEQATAAITADVLDQDSIFIVFLQTSAAESTTPPQLLDLHIEALN